MNENEFDFCASPRPDELNFRTKLTVPSLTVIQNVQHLFYLKERYYSDFVWRVPIPNTLESKKVFSQNILSLDDNSYERYLAVEQIENPFYPGKRMGMPRFAQNNVNMPFAEALVATRDIVLALGKKCVAKYGVFSVRSCLDQSCPATTNELAIYLQSSAKDKFQITLEDFLKSQKYWSQYLFRTYG
jgi:hypothetical protein